MGRLCLGQRGGDAADAGVAGVVGGGGVAGAAEGGVVCWRAGRYNGPRWPQPISSAALAPARAAEAARSNALAARAAIVVRVEGFDMRGKARGGGGAVGRGWSRGRGRSLRASHWPRSSTAVNTAGITSRLSS